MSAAKLQDAFAKFNAGDLASADRLCGEVLHADPRNPQALHLQGIVRMAGGNPEGAVSLLGRAAELRPQDAAIQEHFGIACLAAGRPGAAEAAFNMAIRLGANHGLIHMRLGMALAAQGQPAAALAALQKAADLAPDDIDVQLNFGNALAQSGRSDEAIACYRRVVALQPGNIDAQFNIAACLMSQGRLDAAAAALERILELAPGYVDAYASLGQVRARQGRLEAAVECYDRLLAVRTDIAAAYHERSDLLRQMRRYEEALADSERALALQENFPAALNCRGNLLHALKRYEDAIPCFDRLIALRPALAQPFYNKGLAHSALGRHDAALECYDQALARDPSFAKAHFERGNTLRATERQREAIASFDEAVRFVPDHAEAWHNRAAAFHDIAEYRLALESMDRALAIKPDFAEAYVGRGNALQAMREYPSAVAAYEKACELDPKLAPAFFQRALTFQKMGAFTRAISDYEKVIALNPDYPYCRGNLYYLKMHSWHWAGTAESEAILAAGAGSPNALGEPLAAVVGSLSPADQLQYARKHANIVAQGITELPRPSKARREKIRVAYLSPDFRHHPVAYLTAELFELHDRSEFEIFGVSFGVDDHSRMRQRLVAGFDHFLDVQTRRDNEIAALLREKEIDVAVDLCGHTSGARMEVFAYRPAPVQVNYLGYPGTLGASFFDYILADSFLVPGPDQIHYAEKVVYLPDCYQVNDRKREAATLTPTRAEAGLPASGFVFCCFNTSFKITPAMFDIWMRLLSAVEGSVLWLVGGNNAAENIAAENNLKREAAARGVAPQRLVFAPRANYADYLARYRLADLFLDTLPFNAGTTASDALWMGLPVLTCAGKAFSGRVAGSMLNAIGLPELVTDSTAAYEALAFKLATQPEILGAIRNKLAQNRLTTPLFNVERTCRHVESAYKTMVEIWRKGEPPRSFAVTPVD